MGQVTVLVRVFGRRYRIRRGLYRRGRGGRRRNKGSVLKVLMCVELRRLGVNRQ